MATKTLLGAIGLGAAMMASGSPGAASAAERVDVPVSQVVLPDGNIRYSVPVTVGEGAPIAAELDTGSFGLRVLKAALTPGQYEETALHRSYGFGGGAKFDGVLARAVLGVGPMRTAAPALFQLIDHVGCVAEKPDCFAARLKPEEYRIAGDGYAGQGFSAILGLSMRRAATDDSAQNPLTATGDRSWILVLPRPGSAAPGHLVIDPDEADRAGFTPLKLAPEGEVSGKLSGWADAALEGCLVEEGGRRLCGPTVLDSGAPGVSVGSADVAKPAPLGAGRKARLEIGGAGGAVSVPFTSGGDWSTRVVVQPVRGAGGPRMSAGTLPYFSYEVLYDATSGTMGFKPRDPAAP